MRLMKCFAILAILIAANMALAGSVCTQRVVNAQVFIKGSTTISLSGQLTESAMDSLSNGESMAIYNSLDSYLVFPTLLPRTKAGFVMKSKTQNISVSTKNGKFQWTEKVVTSCFAFAAGEEKVKPEKATFKSSGSLSGSTVGQLDEKKLTVFDFLCEEQGLGYLASLSFTPEKKGKNYQFSLKNKEEGLQVKVSVNSKGKASASYKMSPRFATPALIDSEYIFTNKYDYSFEQIGEGGVKVGFVGPDLVELQVTENIDKFRYFTRNGEKITEDSVLVDLEEDTDFTAVFGNYDLTVDVVGNGFVGVEYIGPDEVKLTAFAGADIFQSFSWDGNVSSESPLIIAMTGDTVVTATFVNISYIVIDISKGFLADSWPYRYSADGPDVKNDECKTTELWLKFIPAGEFTMGSPESEYGRGSREVAHSVTLTKGFFIGVFEMTKRQHELITGTDPLGYDDSYPVTQVTFDFLRGTDKGANWPADDEVDDGSFMGILRAKTGLRFDLPTEAQWEYACRATTTNAFNNGKNLDDPDLDLSEIAYYKENAGGTRKVGSLKPNQWGLYDMHGNVWEWCLDWYTDNLGTEPVVDPVGLTTGNQKTLRGGSFNDEASACRSAYRAHTETDHNMDRLGFRPVINQ